MKHNCRNPKFCPKCRQKIRREVKKFFEDNPDVLISYDDLIKQFDLKYTTAQKIFDDLEKQKIIIRKYRKTKRLTTGSGIKTYFYTSNNRFRPYKVNSKSWLRLF